jgi:hypothetical protein
MPCATPSIEAYAVIDDCHDQPVRIADEVNRYAAGRAVRERIVQRFLRDAEQAERDVVRQVVGDAVGRKVDDAVGPGQLALKAAQRRNQAQHPQTRRVQLVRQIVQALGDPVGALTRLLDQRDRVRALPAFPKQLQIDRQQRHLLVDIVVQLARDPGALGFLRQQQSTAEIVNPLVAGAKRGLVFADLDLRPSPHSFLQEQPRDEHRLRDREHRRQDNFVAIPSARLGI